MENKKQEIDIESIKRKYETIERTGKNDKKYLIVDIKKLDVPSEFLGLHLYIQRDYSIKDGYHLVYAHHLKMDEKTKKEIEKRKQKARTELNAQKKVITDKIKDANKQLKKMLVNGKIMQAEELNNKIFNLEQDLSKLPARV